jgi:hypothetical protein
MEIDVAGGSLPNPYCRSTKDKLPTLLPEPAKIITIGAQPPDAHARGSTLGVTGFRMALWGQEPSTAVAAWMCWVSGTSLSGAPTSEEGKFSEKTWIPL